MSNAGTAKQRSKANTKAPNGSWRWAERQSEQSEGRGRWICAERLPLPIRCGWVCDHGRVHDRCLNRAEPEGALVFRFVLCILPLYGSTYWSSAAPTTEVKAKKKWIEGWQIKNFFDICFAILSFVVFLLLEAALIYSYFVLIHLL